MEHILRRELKIWQRAFKQRHGRDPTKRDILADDSISGTYETWQAVGGDTTAKPRSSKRSEPSSTKATSSKNTLDDNVVRTPSKRRVTAQAGASPSKNPFRTPTKRSSPSQKENLPRQNPFATPSRRAAASVPASPAGSVVDVEMTPKRSPLLTASQRAHAFTPSKSSLRVASQQQQYVTASPSKLRTAVAAASRLTPTKPVRTDGDAALRNALVAYTPRTKARKRLRGEDVPPTPARAGGRAGTDPRPAQRGLAAFGLATQRKPPTMPAPASAFPLRTVVPAQMSDDEDVLDASPVKAVARRGSGKPGFRPLFASPSSHAPVDILAPSTSGCTGDADEDAVMHDAGPAGGIFGAEVQRRRRLRELSPAASKKPKTRSAPILPSSDCDDDLGASSSPPAPQLGEDDDDAYAMFNTLQTTSALVTASTPEPEPNTALAGLHLSPVHLPSSKDTNKRLLDNIFHPTSSAPKHPTLNPHARFHLHQPDLPSPTDDDDDDADPTANLQDDDDWLQEVDADYTFLDTEIQLNDIA
ncbi:uncharacterized protein PSANT_00303 [Moesziomyces antarcticus]|uniref:DNA replication regulator SLD2 n=1 Tax=Pseudozyma antarctica TaxID=84753 RepID=A0A5C3FEC4_PSEA2|nr:uncharacterized protein PSANT_00303 [Moesziomyces antarcticus]